MIAALYARKSTEQTVADEAKSVTRQIDHARAYAARKGWMVADAHVYVDDGISGAEFLKRPGFLRLMNALKPRPPFQVLIMSEESRLGREAIETAYALKQLIAAGVRIFFYLENRERTLDSPTDKIMLSLTAFADELEREKARQRTYDAMQRKAKAGHVTGGGCFGYRNIVVTGPTGTRSHVERRINDAEAAIRAAGIPALCRRPRYGGHRQAAECRRRAVTAGAAGPIADLGAELGARRALSRCLPRRDRVEPHAQT
jgi:DNA invertase Pin-like site-specific DNA recombinase